MERSVLIWGILGAFILLLTPSAMGQSLDYSTAYDSGKQLFGSDYIAPRMDCEANGINCTLLVYRNSTNKLLLYRTTDGFESKTLAYTMITDSNYEDLIALNPATAVPYDVIYQPSVDVFGINLVGNSNSYHYNLTSNSLTSAYDWGCSNCLPYQIPYSYSGKYWRRFYASNCTDDGDYRSWDGTSSGSDANGITLSPNTSCTSIGADYLAGIFIHREGEYNFYTAYAFNSSTKSWNAVNNSDSFIPIDYDGVYEKSFYGVLSNYEYLIRNSTHIIMYDKATNGYVPLYKFDGNEIKSQSRWIDPATQYRQIIVFENSTGVYRGIPSYDIPSYSPEPQFTDPDVQAIPVSSPLQCTPYGVDVACSDDGTNCLSAVYVECLFGLTKGIQLSHSTDGFDNINYKTTITADFSMIRNLMSSNGDDEHKLPFSVAWDEDTSKFYISSRRKIYSYDLNTVTEIRDAGDWQYLGLINRQNENYAIKIYGSGQDICINAIDIVSGSATSDFACRSEVGGGAYLTDIKSAYGYLFTQNDDSPFGNVLIDINYHYGYFLFGVGNSNGYDSITQGTKPSPRTDVYYYDTTDDYFRYETNANGKGVYQAYSTDLSTYLAPYPEYLYDLDVNEKIQGYTSKRADRANYYSYMKNTDTFLGRSRIPYVYEEWLYTTKASSFYRRPYFGERYSSANMSITLECITTNETYTYYGDFAKFYHSCDEYNLIYNTLTYKPSTFTRHINYPTDCSLYYVDTKFLSPYDFQIFVASEPTGGAIEGAQVSFGGKTETTDSNGIATFNVFPLDGVSMDEYAFGTGSCDEEWRANASATKNYFATITKSGYKSVVNEQVEVATVDADGEIHLSDYEEYSLKPVGASVLVRLRDKNGKEIENREMSSSTSISGNFTDSLIIDPVTEKPYIGTQAIGVPIEFWAVFNQSSLNVTLNFTYQSYNDNKTITLTQDETTTVWFKLNTSITEMECQYNYDCLTDFCRGSYFYQLTGCNGGKCSYREPEFCAGGCDEDVGCYQNKLDITCDTNQDCISNCTSDWVSLVGLCASDGYCIQKKDICEATCPDKVMDAMNVSYPVGCSSVNTNGFYKGMCCGSSQCFEEGRQKYLFQLKYLYLSPNLEGFNPTNPLSIIGLIPEKDFYTALDYNYYCGIENRGERTCLKGTSFNKIEDNLNVGVIATPENWKFRITNNKYHFYDLSIYCGANCDVEWDYCKYGCNTETGYCYHQPIGEQNVTERYDVDIYQPVSIIEDSLNQTQVRESGLGFLLLLVTPIFIVTIISVIVGIVCGYFTKEPVLGLVGFLAVLVVFSILQLFPIWLSIALILVVGMIFSRMFLNMIRGS